MPVAPPLLLLRLIAALLFIRASQRLLPDISLSKLFRGAVASFVSHLNHWLHIFAPPSKPMQTHLPHHRHPSCRPTAPPFPCRSAAGCPSTPTEPSCCI